MRMMTILIIMKPVMTSVHVLMCYICSEARQEEIRRNRGKGIRTGCQATSSNTRYNTIYPINLINMKWILCSFVHGSGPFLAQRLGLLDAPAPLLSEKQWHDVKMQSVGRDDSKQPCVICKEDFGTETQVWKVQQVNDVNLGAVLIGSFYFMFQVLLSCTHVFHKVSTG